jgi:hypothetical protein
VSVTCRVFVDGSVTGELFTFQSVPRVGESVQLLHSGNPSILSVRSVLHVAEHTFEDARGPAVQINVSTERAHA